MCKQIPSPWYNNININYFVYSSRTSSYPEQIIYIYIGYFFKIKIYPILINHLM